jgi:nicotinamide riboside transporter PnuC
MIWKLRLPRTLILVGILLIVLSFIADIYSKGLVLAIGIILVVIGIPLWIRSKKIEREKASSATRIRFQ